MPSSDGIRPSSAPPFWDTRYAENESLFGRAPNAFVASEADRIPEGGDVLELGAGEGRTLAWLARKRNARCTAVDFSETALATARRWAREEKFSLEAVEADVRSWHPDRRWDVVIITFLQLLPRERIALYETIQSCIRPGGLVIGEWFRPDHLSGEYDRLGPSKTDRMVPVEELQDAFSEYDLIRCEPVDVELEEGPVLNGRGAVVRFVARRPE